MGLWYSAEDMGKRGPQPRVSSDQLYNLAEALYWTHWRDYVPEYDIAAVPDSAARNLDQKMVDWIAEKPDQRIVPVRFRRESSPNPLPGLLYCKELYAQQIQESKEYDQFPRSNRPSSRLKRWWYLARVMAGAHYGLDFLTALHRIGSKRPEQRARRRRRRAASPVRKTLVPRRGV